jgi:hypothetical protein
MLISWTPKQEEDAIYGTSALCKSALYSQKAAKETDASKAVLRERPITSLGRSLNNLSAAREQKRRDAVLLFVHTHSAPLLHLCCSLTTARLEFCEQREHTRRSVRLEHLNGKNLRAHRAEKVLSQLQSDLHAAAFN